MKIPYDICVHCIEPLPMDPSVLVHFITCSWGGQVLLLLVAPAAATAATTRMALPRRILPPLLLQGVTTRIHQPFIIIKLQRMATLPWEYYLESQSYCSTWPWILFVWHTCRYYPINDNNNNYNNDRRHNNMMMMMMMMMMRWQFSNDIIKRKILDPPSRHC